MQAIVIAIFAFVAFSFGPARAEPQSESGSPVLVSAPEAAGAAAGDSETRIAAKPETPRPRTGRANGGGRYGALIAKHAAEAGVPLALADAVVRIESRYNASATNRGAVGLMQIKPQTARSLGYRGDAGGLMNPDTNLRYGMRYLAQAYRLSGGDTCTALLRYQSGNFAARARGGGGTCGKARAIMTSFN